jgi:apolipoprotein D and lipocalin family protein
MNARQLALLAFVTVAGCATAPPKPPLRTVQHVELPRYMGDWRVIANIPYFAERGCVDSIESYALRPDGKIANWFRYRKHSFDAPQKRVDFVAEVVDHHTNAEWKVHFAPLISAGYYIIDLDPNYRWTVVGHPSRKYGWIMARERTIPAKTYEQILRRLANEGYDPKLFVKVPQTAPKER